MQRDTALNQLNTAEDTAASCQTSLTNLQIVLEQFQQGQSFPSVPGLPGTPPRPLASGPIALPGFPSASFPGHLSLAVTWSSRFGRHPV